MPRSSVAGQQRRRALSRLLVASANVSTGELADHFAVSEMTIRRDLRQLQADGVALPCYGGAMAAQRITFEFEFDERRRAYRAEKKRIGQAAAEHVAEGQTLFLDTGTTTLEVAKALASSSKAVRVVTSSLVIASEMWARPNLELQLLGGTVRGNSPDLAGPFTEIMLERLTADIAILGSDGLDPTRGSFAVDVETARISERMAAGARRSIVVCDRSKLGRTSAVRCLELDDIDMLVTDKAADRTAIRKLRAQGVQIQRV